MKKTMLWLSLVLLVLLLCCSAFADEYIVKKQYMFGSKPIKAGASFVIRLQYAVYPQDGIVTLAAANITTTSGIRLDKVAGTGGNQGSNSSFSFPGNGMPAISIDIKATVRPGAGENESVTVSDAKVRLKNGQVFTVSGMTVKIPVQVAHTHSLQQISRTEPSCVQTGEIIYQCTGCEYTKTETIPAIGHQFGQTVVRAASCEQDGETNKVCSVCHDKKVLETIPKTGHSYEKIGSQPATCEEKGWIQYRCGHHGCPKPEQIEYIDPIGHQYGERITEDPRCEQPGRIYQRCSICKKENVIEELSPLGHAYIEIERKEPACFEDGWVLYRCKREACGQQKRETLPQPGHHDYIEQKRVPSTCRTPGTVYMVCARQGCDAQMQQALPLAEHQYGEEMTVLPHCQQTGEVYRLCIVCGTKQQVRILDILGHQYGDLLEEAPTCTQDGQRYRKCDRCGDICKVDVIPSTGHQWSAWIPPASFDCEQGGQYARNCSVCHTQETRDVAPEKHQPGPLSILCQPTCTEDGEMGTVCRICQRVTFSVPVEATGHQFASWERPKDISCHIGWEEQSTCTVCGAQGTRQIAAGEHQFNLWSITRQASCTQKGERKRVCDVCGEVEKEEIPMDYHALGIGRVVILPTCERDGTGVLACRNCDYKEYYTLSALGHDWGELSAPEGADCAKGWIGVRHCKRNECAAQQSEAVAAGQHRFGGWMIDILPKCFKEGLKRHICTLCGTEETEIIPGTMGHSFGTPVLTVTPTCETEGACKTVCRECGLTETHPLAALGHKWQELCVKPATCTTGGQIERQCERCEKNDSVEIPPKGHQPGEWKILADATCDHEGQSEASCLICGETLSEAIPLRAHEFSAWVVTVPAACEKEGQERHECTLCGLSETRVIPEGRHQLTFWQEERRAGCTEQGIYHRSCEVCGKEETMYTDLKPHTFDDWHKGEFEDCEQGGIRRRICTICNQEETQVLPARKHWMGAWRTIYKDSCEENGSRERACKRCGKMESAVLVAQGHKAARKYQILRRARPYHPGVRAKKCVRCGALLEKMRYAPSLKSLKTVFCPAGVPLKELLPGSTKQWYTVVPIDTRQSGERVWPLVANNRHTVGEMTVSVDQNAIKVSCSYFDDRTVVFKPMLRVFSSLDEITPARIKRRVKGYPLDKPISLERFGSAQTLYLYLRVEGVYDDQRPANIAFDATAPENTARKEELLRLVNRMPLKAYSVRDASAVAYFPFGAT